MDAAKLRASQKFGCSKRTIDRVVANRDSDPADKPSMTDVIGIFNEAN
jgi:hypothetical protein